MTVLRVDVHGEELSNGWRQSGVKRDDLGGWILECSDDECRRVLKMTEIADFCLRNPCSPLDGAYHCLYIRCNFLIEWGEQKVEIDSFSGYRIYPSKGKLFVRGDSKVCIHHILRSIRSAFDFNLPCLDLPLCRIEK